MKHNTGVNWIISLVALIVLLSTANAVNAQDAPFFKLDEATKSLPHPNQTQRCTGAITSVVDIGAEGVRTTAFN
ncbi:MAG: hypothetical protein WBV94_27445 [Blastocatellia bacterium]